jgi:(p)ppGpp synthase/HD superfamily hydrolase
MLYTLPLACDGGKLMIEAAMFAAAAHRGQNRKYHAQPYIAHPARIAATLMTKGAEPALIAAAWLHDVVEDCKVEPHTIDQLFGERVCGYVVAMTNPSKGLRGSRAEKKAIDREHWATITDADAQWLKVEDRLDNLRDAWAGPKDWRIVYAKESSLLIDVLTLAPEDIRQDCYNVIDHLLGISE